MPNEAKFNQRDLEIACDDLATMPYFPHESRASVMRLLVMMCPHREALRWLVDQCVNHVGKWPGLSELRGLLCTRYDPADGVDQPCSLPGYRPMDFEDQHFERHQMLKSGGFEQDHTALQSLTEGLDTERLQRAKARRLLL